MPETQNVATEEIAIHPINSLFIRVLLPKNEMNTKIYYIILINIVNIR